MIRRAVIIWFLPLYLVTMVGFPLLDGEKFSILKLVLGIPLWLAVAWSIVYLRNDWKKTPVKKKKR